MISLVHIWTDGASTGVRGPGGWAYLVKINNVMSLDCGGVADNTTNSRMEMYAVIVALESLEPSEIRLYSDSSMVINGMRQKWISKWEKNGWKNSRLREVANRDLWERLQIASLPHEIEWVKVKAHSSSNSYIALGNRRVDALAHAECQKMKKENNAKDSTDSR